MPKKTDSKKIDITEISNNQDLEVAAKSNTESKTKRTKNPTVDEVSSNSVASNGGSEEYITKPIDVVIHESMLPYSEHVIMDRALPRVEDGLKPVQRRVLYSMLEVGVLPDRPYRKSARIVGDCMGRYHPHGDSSIYETMVRMAQPFNMGEILVDGHGNYGSVDGDGAAAMRYTEARLTPLSLELLRDIDKDTVSWSLNFDDSCKEPDMLPGRFPNLLVNGSMGIAVGLATNIPTHNLKECCEAVCAYIDNKNITLKQLMKVIPGPDFPTGAYILKSSELEQVYASGKGKIVIRSKFHIENADGDKKNIVFTEIPYQVNKATLLQKIASLKEADEKGDLSYIQDIVDESDRNGTRAVIKLKKDAKVQNILNILFKQTNLETTFNANIVAIADGKPKQLSLIEILQYYVDYQQKIIYNRTKFDLEACLKKEHILEGLLIAIKNIDEVVKIIKTSKNVTDAKINLMQKFTLTDVQAQAILDMRLARLTSLEVDKLVTELKRLKDLIARYTAILKSPALQLKIVKQEIMEIAKKYGSPRKTEFIAAEEFNIVETNGSSAIQEELNIISTPLGTIKSVNKKSYNMATKELGSNPTIAEIPENNILLSNSSTLGIFTNVGNYIQLKVSNINQCKFKDKGAYVSSYVKNVSNKEKVVSLFEFNESNSDQKLVFVTRKGMVKVSKVSEYICAKSVVAGIKMKDDDELIGVELMKTGAELGVFTKSGIGMIVPIQDIASSGRVSMGVKAISLSKDDSVIGSMQLTEEDAVCLFTNNGIMRTVKYKYIPKSLRNKKGSRLITVKNGVPSLVYASLLLPNIDYVLEQKDGKLSMIKNKDIAVVKPTEKVAPLKYVKDSNPVINVYKYTL